MSTRHALVLLATLSACGGGAGGFPNTATGQCTRYFDAFDTCYGSASDTDGFDGFGGDFGEALCQTYEALQGFPGTAAALNQTRDAFKCSANALESGDCSTEEGLDAVSTELEKCDLEDAVDE